MAKAIEEACPPCPLGTADVSARASSLAGPLFDITPESGSPLSFQQQPIAFQVFNKITK